MRRIKDTKYGLVWHRDSSEEDDVNINPDARTPSEIFPNEVAGKPFPVLQEVKSKEIRGNKDKPVHLLIEGDNYHSLAVLNFTHQERIDVIYIDPPYNTGKKDFVYNDKIESDYVPQDDPFRHSKWLSFMEKRLKLARQLLSQTGVIIVHIDENEDDALYFLLCDIFGEENNLGKIIWNKKNPKGNTKGVVSTMHESIMCFAKSKTDFAGLENASQCRKRNADAMFQKAAALFKKIGKAAIPEEIREIAKPFGLAKNVLENFKVTYSLDLVNKEFQSWLSRQDFSGGEKGYKFIDENGDIYQSVSMASPDKKQGPAAYSVPLVHPVTKKKCPIPSNGWRWKPETMKEYMEKGRIIFGKDESTQPRQKYFLEENLWQNTPSIFADAASDDKLFANLGIKFDYPKPYTVSAYLLSAIHPNPKVILDFMAGSGTTGHAVLALNHKDSGDRQFILCTNNENNICSDICHPRLKKVIGGYTDLKGNKVTGLGGGSVKYYACDFVAAESTDKNRRLLVAKSTEMLCIRENAFELVQDQADFKIFKSSDRYLGIVFDEDAIDAFKKAIKKISGRFNAYVFSLSDDPHEKQFSDVSEKVSLCPIPEVILKVYREIFR